MPRREPVLIVDLLRFVAAAGVVGYHLATANLLPGAPLHLFAPDAALPVAGSRWTWPGWVGVEIFFVISGFVIARSAEGTSPTLFLRRRLLRLAPAAWICATVTAVLLLASGAMTPDQVEGRWSAAVLFLPTVGNIDGSYWTLKVELVFYLLAALTIARCGQAATGTFAAILGGASIAFWIVAIWLGWAVHDFPLTFVFNMTLLPHGVFFALGMVIARAQQRGWTLAGAAGAALLVTAAAAEIAEHSRVVAVLPGAHPAATPVTLFALAVAAIIAGSRLQPLLTRWPGPVRLAALGQVTYPLYLLHQVVGAALVAAMLGAGIPAAAAIPSAAALILVGAFAVSTVAEPWLRRALDRVLSRPRAPRPDSCRNASLPIG